MVVMDGLVVCGAVVTIDLVGEADGRLFVVSTMESVFSATSSSGLASATGTVMNARITSAAAPKPLILP